jgi:hypothetical protein
MGGDFSPPIKIYYFRFAYYDAVLIRFLKASSISL